jgi:hypothetical protein
MREVYVKRYDAAENDRIVRTGSLRDTTPRTYLILIRDGRRALAVATALEERMVRDGRAGLTLIPAIRGSDFPGAGYQRQLQAWHDCRSRNSAAPQVVALHENGILEKLESLGLAAYIGVPKDSQWRILRWQKDAGAIFLPVATVRDLVEGIARHTPWERHAAQLAGGTPRHRRPAGQGSLPGALALSRKLAITSTAGMAGSLLLFGLPSVAQPQRNHQRTHRHQHQRRRNHQRHRHRNNRHRQRQRYSGSPAAESRVAMMSDLLGINSWKSSMAEARI